MLISLIGQLDDLVRDIVLDGLAERYIGRYRQKIDLGMNRGAPETGLQ